MLIDLVVRLAAAVERCIRELRAGDTARLAAGFRSRLNGVGREVELRGAGFALRGELADVDLRTATMADGRRVPLALVAALVLA